MRPGPLPELKKLHGLRERRAELAEREVVAAQAAVREAEAALAARDRRIVAIDQSIAELTLWFSSGVEARLLTSALARQGALADARLAELKAREGEVANLAKAVELREAAVRALAKARGKLDAAAMQLANARRARGAALEAAAEVEAEDRGARRSFSLGAAR